MGALAAGESELLAKQGSTTRTVDRALLLLTELVVGDSNRSLSALARAVELSPSTALRLLNTLVSHGYAEQSMDGGYQLGVRVKQLGVRAVREDFLLTAAEPILGELASETDETACLGAAVGQEEVVYLLQVNSSSRRVQTIDWVGRTIPQEDTALGRALRGDVTGAGFSVSARHDIDVVAVAAPVRDHSKIIAAISVNAPKYRTSAADAERFGYAALAAAEALSGQLGAHHKR